MDPTIDIFRDPVYEEMGFIFDPDRNQYFEIIDHPEYGEIRSYISPREDGPVPELSEPRMRSDTRQEVADFVSESMGGLGGLVARARARKKAEDLDDSKNLDIFDSRLEPFSRMEQMRNAGASDRELSRFMESRGMAEGGEVDIFTSEVIPASPRPPSQPTQAPNPMQMNFNQIQIAVERPDLFRSQEGIEARYRLARNQIKEKRDQGGYGQGEAFDRAAMESDFRRLNKMLEQGMPPRLYPATTPYSAGEAEIIAEITQTGGIPSPEAREAGIRLERGPDSMASRMDKRIAKDLKPMDALTKGLGSFLGRFSGSSGEDDLRFTLERQGRGPEISLFRKTDRPDRPDMTGIQFTRRF